MEVKRVGSTAARLDELPYEKRVAFLENYPTCLQPPGGWERPVGEMHKEVGPEGYEPLVGPSVEEYVEIIAEMGAEVQIVCGEVQRGTPRFPSQLIPPHPHVAQDRLPDFLKLAHERGIIVLSYFSMNFNRPLKQIHPEWLMEFVFDGRPVIENEGWWCFNSPYRDWLPEYLIEFLDHLDLDGFYLDDTNYGSHEGRPFYPSCCCGYCAELFKRESGLDIPRKVDFESADFRTFLNWRYEKTRAFVQHVFGRVHEKYPDAIHDFHYYGRPTTYWDDGHALEPLGVEQTKDYFFSEAHRTVREAGFVAKVGRARGAPFGVLRLLIQSMPEIDTQAVPYPLKDPYLVHGLSAIANGAHPYFGYFEFPYFQNQVLKEVFAELKKRVEYIGGETVKQVGLLYSTQNRDFRPSELPKNKGDAHYMDYSLKDVYGAYEMLNRSHHLVDLVFDGQLDAELLRNYPVLFLSDCSCLSESQCEQIRNYVRNGGTLIATHQTSLLDEFGQPRGGFALGDLFGVEYEGPGDEEVHGIVYVPRDDALLEKLGLVLCFAGSESKVTLSPQSTAEALCTRGRLDAVNALRDFHPDRQYDTGAPAVTVNRFGAGEAIYISGDVGGAYAHNPHLPLKHLVSALVRRAGAPLEVEAPQAIEVTATTGKNGKMTIHLLNSPTPMVPLNMSEDVISQFFIPQEINPVRDIIVHLNDFEVNRVWMPLSQVELTPEGPRRTIRVPEVRYHEVIQIESKH